MQVALYRVYLHDASDWEVIFVRRKSFADMLCPIARSLNVVGEWWTLLIVRDAFDGARRFEDFRATGIADNILSTRLDLLVREGILERQAYQEHPPRYEYLLTEKGRELLPIIVALGVWGLRWTDGPKAPPAGTRKVTSAAIMTASQAAPRSEAVRGSAVQTD
jgi:DNA-binding HxlR family transcriptional regulator